MMRGVYVKLTVIILPFIQLFGSMDADFIFKKITLQLKLNLQYKKTDHLGINLFMTLISCFIHA